MRVLLVTPSYVLPQIIPGLLNHDLEYTAVVVDEPAPIREFVTKTGGYADIVFPFHDLKECIENCEYDYIFAVSETNTVEIFPNKLRKYGAPLNKTVHFYLTNDGNNSHIIKRALTYFKKNSKDFDMIATGMSYTSFGLDSDRFKGSLFNFAKASQDLYYDYQIAKFAVDVNRGRKIRYALIGLAPYSFHFDLSKTIKENWRLIHYCVALNDMHNFHMPSEKCRKFFQKSFFDAELPLEQVDLNNVNADKIKMDTMNLRKRLDLRDRAEAWSDKSKNFVETRDENIKILDDYLTLCKKNNIRPIIFLPPMSEGYMKHFSREKLDEFYHIISAATDKFSDAIFVDGWKISEFADGDFCDADHLNLLGAAKFSSVLNMVIEQNDNF